MKFVHAADIHLDSPLHGLERYEGAPVDEIRGATRQAFANLVELCGSEQVHALLLAGDLYDGDWRDFGTGLFFAKQMVRLRDMGVRVFVVRGNHDAASRISRDLRLPDNVHVFSTRRAETVRDENRGMAVHGRSFPRAEVTEDLSAAYPEPVPGLLNIGLLHTCAGGRPGHAPYAPCSVEALSAHGYQYWALGHVHRREVLHRHPWVVFAGNLQGRHARETGPKGCTVVSAEDGDVVSVEERHVDLVRWAVLDVDAAGCTARGEVLDRLATALRAAVDAAEGRLLAARVRVGGPCEAHVSLHHDRESWIADARALATDIGSGAVWLEKVLIKTTPEGARGGSGPLADLCRDLGALSKDGDRLAAMVHDFASLGEKLPEALRGGDDPLLLDADTIRALLPDVEAILLSRLSGNEDT